MKVTTEPLEKCEVLLTVEVDEAQANQLMKAAAQRISRRVQIPGFRPGKAPYALIERRIGQEAIRHEVLEDLGDKIFREALKQADLEPFAAPSMEDISWQPLTVKVRIPVAPVVELGDYRALRLPIPAVEVEEAEIDEALSNLQDERATWKPVDRPAQFGDKLTMMARVVARGKTVVEDDDAELTLAERDEDVSGPDIVTPMVGASAGEEREFVVTYPDDYPAAELAGADATVTIRVHEVLEKETYPLDDDFAQMIGDFATLADLRDRLRADLLERKQRQADRELADRAFQEVVAGASRIEWPRAAEDEALDLWMSNVERNMKERGLLLEDYLRTQQKTLEQLREEMRPQLEEQLRLSYVAREIARREGLKVGAAEVTDYIELMADIAGERRDEVWRFLTSQSGVRQTARELLDAKIRGRLLSIVKGELEDAPDAAARSTEPVATGETVSAPAAKISPEDTPVLAENATEDASKATSRTRRKPKAASVGDEPDQS